MTQDQSQTAAETLVSQDADAGHDSFGERVRSAVFWRSGGQILTQVLSWAVTLAVIRILNPADYGLFAMTQVVLNFMTFLNGYGLISALVQSESIDSHKLRQAFGLMILMNGGLALAQLAVAPLAADYYRQPMVADLLRAQALIYLATPFISLPEVLMGRSLDFRRPAFVNLITGLIAAAVAIGGALAGWGVWTLVWAPVAGFWSKAIGYLIVTRFFVWPSFDFRGMGTVVIYAISLLGTQLFFLVQSQADVFIGGRVLDPHTLGLYAEALFLTQIFVSKFIPPLNDVAFPAYSRMQADKSRVAWSFAKAIRLLMLVACPLYLGMAVTAEPLVETLFGEKWLAMAPLVAVLALAMPFLALQVMFPPVCNAMGRPGLSARIAIIGAVIMPVAFLVGIRFGALGLAVAWLCAYPVFALVTAHIAGGLIGLRFRTLAASVAPGFISATAMALVVMGVDSLLPPLAAPIRLTILVAVGAGSFVGLLALVSRETIRELIELVIRRRPPASEAEPV
jgi:O-antigen/teichoic acid export membrane protein